MEIKKIKFGELTSVSSMAMDLNNSVTSIETGIWFGLLDVGEAMSSSVLIGSSIFTVFLDGFVSAAVFAVYF